MPFTRHKLQEIKEGNLRARCATCGQAWTSWHVRSACPGVTVYVYEELPTYLKTLTALERERKYPPDPEQWDGAYRILKAPYYRLVYDERKALHQPLSAKQIAANERRAQAITEKYTCRACGKFYTNRYDRQAFFAHTCNSCRIHINHYNDQIAWARVLVENQAIVLDIRTRPDVHPYMEEPERPLLIGFTALDLVSGEIVHEADMTRREDLHSIGWLCCPEYSALDPYPNVVICYPSSLYAVRFELERNAKKGLYLFNPNLTELLVSAHVEYVLKDGVAIPQSVYGWNDSTWFKGWTARQALEHVCLLHGIEEASKESTATLIRQLVLHLAALKPIELVANES